MREQFEKLPEIAERLHTVAYNEDLNQYHAAMINSGLSVKYIQGAWYAFQEQQKKIDAHNKKLSLFIDELRKTHGEDIDNKMDYWRGFSDCAETTVKVFYRDVGVVTCKE